MKKSMFSFVMLIALFTTNAVMALGHEDALPTDELNKENMVLKWGGRWDKIPRQICIENQSGQSFSFKPIHPLDLKPHIGSVSGQQRWCIRMLGWYSAGYSGGVTLNNDYGAQITIHKICLLMQNDPRGDYEVDTYWQRVVDRYNHTTSYDCHVIIRSLRDAP